MMRALFTILGVFCIALVATEAAGTAFLWSQGRLTVDVIHDVRDILSGKPVDVAPVEERDEQTVTQASGDEVMQKRIERLFELGNREDELLILKTMISEQAQRVTALQDQLQKKRDDFDAKLKELRAQTNEESIQQSRAVLQALQPADAAETVMGLTFEQSLAVVRGMPEKSIARILKELARGDDKKSERGRKLFEAITEGEPSKSLIEETAKQQSLSAPETN